jgi:hypothetical protein
MRGAARLAIRQGWRGVLIAGVLIAVLAEPRAQPAPAPAGDDALVLSADEMLGAAMRAGDKSVARKALSLQFTFVDENGKVFERKEFLGGLKELAAAAASGVKVKIYGRIAIVTGQRKSAHDTEVFFLDIWAKQKGSWRALEAQDVELAANDAAPKPPAAGATSPDCKNPCETIPYRVRSPAEQDIVNTFQAIAKAIFARDAGEYAKHTADEFVHYQSGYPPTPRSERIASFTERKKDDIPAIMTSIQAMRLWVYDDSAVMISANGAPDDTMPLFRIARVWVKRNGQWLIAISVQTDVKNPEAK